MKPHQPMWKGCLVGLGVCVACLGSHHADAEGTATIRVGGTVSSVKKIAVIPQPAHDTLDLETGVKDALVGVVQEQSNAPSGYVVTLTSANARTAGSSTPILAGAANPAQSIAYSIAYGLPGQEQSVQLNSAGAGVVTEAAGKTPRDGVSKNLRVTVPAGDHAADSYSDTLVLTLAAK